MNQVIDVLFTLIGAALAIFAAAILVGILIQVCGLVFIVLYEAFQPPARPPRNTHEDSD